MGLIQHHALVAITWDQKSFECIVAQINERTDCDQFLLNVTKINAYYTIIIPPDGSKEGWEESDAGDARRDWLLKIIAESEHAGRWDWIEVEFGELDAAICRERRRDNREADEAEEAD